MSNVAAKGTARGLALLVLVLVGTPQSAHAYTYASSLSAGCHEGITLTALREVRRRLDITAPEAMSRADRAWIDDLPLDLPADARELPAATLIAGVRDNDLKGRHGLDSSHLALVHGDPHAQCEHCLRGPEHDEPDGTERALAECRASMRERFVSALAGLDAEGRVDLDARLGVDIHLAFAGARTVRMPRLYVELGRALHTLQDSFSHAVRSPDGSRVRVLLNWTDYVQEHAREERDGPAHRSALDDCEDLDPLRALRLQHATDASTEVIQAALDPSLDADARLAAFDDVLDRYLAYEPGCAADNGFCDAEELGYPPQSTACGIASPRVVRSHAWVLVGLGIVLWLRRRPPRDRACRGTFVVRALLAVATFGFAQAAQARSDDAHDFALSSSLSASIDVAAAAAALGGHYRLSDRVLLGVGAEWNPWTSIELREARPGTFNAYGALIVRPYVTRDIALRTTVRAGVAMLLFDLYGAPANSIGPYVGLSLIGLELALAQRVRFVLDPAHVVLAVPQLEGIPLSHREYRATVTIELLL